MKKIVLLGDSIRMNYGSLVPSLLSDMTVWQPEDNCRFAKYTLRGIYDWRRHIEGADVVHWNNGLWDTCELFGDDPFTDAEEYVRTMLRVARELKKMSKTVIFATTTPVSPQNTGNSTTRVAAYNSAVVPLLEAEGVRINDLFGLVSPKVAEYICEDTIHLSAAGVEACARQVAASIRAAL